MSMLTSLIHRVLPLPPPIPALITGSESIELQEMIPDRQQPDANDEFEEAGEAVDRSETQQVADNADSSNPRCFDFLHYQEYLATKPTKNFQLTPDDRGELFIVDSNDNVATHALDQYGRDKTASGKRWYQIFMDMSAQGHHNTQFGWTDHENTEIPGTSGWVQQPTPGFTNPFLVHPDQAKPQQSNMHDSDDDSETMEWPLEVQPYEVPTIADDEDDEPGQGPETRASLTEKIHNQCDEQGSKRSEPKDTGFCTFLKKLLSEYLKGENDLLQIWKSNNDKFNFFKRTLSEEASAARVNLMEYQLIKSRVYFMRAQLALLQGEIPLQWFLQLLSNYYTSASKFEFYVKIGVEFSKYLIQNSGTVSKGFKIVQEGLRNKLSLLSNANKLVQRLDCYFNQIVTDLPKLFGQNTEAGDLSSYIKTMKRIIKDIRSIKTNTVLFSNQTSVEDKVKLQNGVSRYIDTVGSISECALNPTFPVQTLEDLPGFGNIESDCEYYRKCTNWTEVQAEIDEWQPACEKCRHYSASEMIKNFMNSAAAQDCYLNLKNSSVFGKSARNYQILIYQTAIR